MTVRHLAEQCGSHPNTVREHLDALVRLRLARTTPGPSGARGRPAVYYAAAFSPDSQVNEYRQLSGALAAHLESRSDDLAGEALRIGQGWGRDIARGIPVPSAAVPAGQRPSDPLAAEPAVAAQPETASPGAAPSGSPAQRTAAAAAAALDLMTDLGYDPRGRGPELRLRQCPVLDVARAHPRVVCQVHLGVIQGVYQAHHADVDAAEVVLLPFAEPGACLVRLPGLSRPA